MLAKGRLLIWGRSLGEHHAEDDQMTKDEAISALRTIMVRDHHGYWWVGGGRNADYSRAMDALLGKPEAQQPDIPTSGGRRRPRKPIQVIR